MSFRGLRFRVLGASFSSFGCFIFEIGCFVFEIWVLRFRVLGASFSSFGCFVFEIWVLRASVFVFECFVFETTLKRISNLLISKMLHVRLKIARCPHYSASLSMLSSSLLHELLLSLSFSCSCVLLFFVVSVILSKSLRECADRFSFISLME